MELARRRCGFRSSPQISVFSFFLPPDGPLLAPANMTVCHLGPDAEAPGSVRPLVLSAVTVIPVGYVRCGWKPQQSNRFRCSCENTVFRLRGSAGLCRDLTPNVDKINRQ